MTEEFIPYARQSISETDQQRCCEALHSRFITRGPKVEAFEEAFSIYCGSRFAVVFNSGSTALLAAYHAAEITAYDRVISTPNTFIATIAPGVQLRAKPIFVDIEETTANLDYTQIENALETPFSRGRPIFVPVHFAGIPLDMEALDSTIKSPEAVIIEDACHALGSRYRDGRRVGSCAYSQMTIFSFHPAKAMTTGEGGMVTTNDETFYRRLLRFRNNGIEHSNQASQPWFYEVQELTSNYNFTEFQAALGLSQLERLEIFIQKRRQLVKLYRELLADVPHVKPLTETHDESTAFHLFVTCIDFEACGKTRGQVMQDLFERGIGTQVHYIPLYRHPALKKSFPNAVLQFPQTEKYYERALSLPLYFDLTADQVRHVVSNLLDVLRR